MILSTNLVSTPFISSTDSTRLQMAAKQISQSVTHKNCEVAKVIGSDWGYLSDSCQMYKYIAPSDGEILYSNEDLIILYLEFDGKTYLQILEVPDIKQCTSNYSITLRYKTDIGKFKQGDLLYEYDSFNYNIPTYGYNLNTIYMPWFGFNHEDAVVLSESTASKMKSIKQRKITIIIQENSLFEDIYSKTSKYGFIPEIGQSVKDGILANRILLKAKYDISQSIHLLKENELNVMMKNSQDPILSDIQKAIVSDIRIHSINKNKPIIYKPLLEKIEMIKHDYYFKIKNIYQDLIQIFTKETINEILSKNYILTNIVNPEFKDACYILEVTLIGEKKMELGDKLASRYANKGVVGLILPDELMPETVNTNKKMDIIISPISIFSRMIFGQLLENIVSKSIVSAEEEIKQSFKKQDKQSIKETLYKLSTIAEILNENKYCEDIQNLANDIVENNDIYHKFVSSVNQLGLYFEVPNFTNFDISKLLKHINTNFKNAEIIEPIRIKKETFEYMKNKLEIDVEIPDEDIIYNHLFSAPTYFLKLRHEALGKLTCRDFGSYKSTNQQPIQGHKRGGGSSKLGQMEIDGLIASGLLNAIVEIFTVKSDAKNLKHNLVSQILTNGVYNIPDISRNSYTKTLIESLIKTIT